MPAGRRHRHRLMVSVARAYRWAAWIENERVLEFHARREDDEVVAGNLFLGRVLRVDKGLSAAFVDIGSGAAVFLPSEEAPRNLVEGADVVVQIERQARNSKSPRATARPVMLGVRLALRPGRPGVAVSERISDRAERDRLSRTLDGIAGNDGGFMLRTAAAGATARQLLDEAAALQAQWRELAATAQRARAPALLLRQPAVDLQLLRDHGMGFDEVLYDSRRAADMAVEWSRTHLPELVPRIAYRRTPEWDLSPADILGQARQGIETKVPLTTGGGIVVQETEAMTVIDVNAQSSGSARADVTAERANLLNNFAAADEIGRQLRLRNVGGIIVVDFVNLKSPAARREVVDRLRAAVSGDPAPVWVGAMSRLGLVELTRQRRGPSLAELMTEPCEDCGGSGRVLADLGAWFPGVGAE